MTSAVQEVVHVRVVLVSVETDPGSPTVRSVFRRPEGELADGLAQAGHEVRELSLFLSGSRSSRGVAGPSLSSAALGLSRALEAGACDVVHAVGDRAGRLVERSGSTRPWVWSYDEADAGTAGRLWHPRTASLVLVPTSGVADELARDGVARSRLRVLPERLSTTVLRGPLDGVRQRAASLVTVLDDRGGTADAVRALSRLGGARLTVLTAGSDRDDQERARLRLIARQLHVEDRLHWIPVIDRVDAVRVLETADVLVHVPHERLDLGPVVAAMSVATAVVVTDLPDADGVVVNGCTGLRVPAADPHRLALRLSILSADPQMRDEVSLAARRLVRDELSSDGSLDAVVATYAEVGRLQESA